MSKLKKSLPVAGRLFGKAIYTESLGPGPREHGGVWSVARQGHLLTECGGQNMGELRNPVMELRGED